MKTAVIYASRKKTLFRLAGTLIFIIVAFSVQDRMPPELFWFATVFIFVCTIVNAWLLISANRIELDSEGFTVLGGLYFAPKKVLWHDVDAFFLQRYRHGTSIAFKYKADARNIGLANWFGGLQVLPPGWNLTAEEMVSHLNDFRQQAIGDMSKSA